MSKTENLIIILATILITTILLVAVVYFIYQYKRKNVAYHTDKKLTLMKHQHELHTAAIEIQQYTMNDIGREIHDGVGQKLTLASIYLKQLAPELENAQQEKALEIDKIVSASLTMLRSLSKELTQEDAINIDLVEGIQDELNFLKSITTCTFLYDGLDSLNLSNKTAKFILRIMQEFINNSLKHSGCSSIKIEVEQDPSGIAIQFQDNGKGFDIHTASTTGVGLDSMKRRADLLNIKYDFVSKPMKGTKLKLTIS